MTSFRALASVVLASLTVEAAPVAARISGGRPRATDCYVEWENVTATGIIRYKVGNRKVTVPVVDCADGDPNCDVDGQTDGACTFNVGACILQRDVKGCVPPSPLTKLRFSKNITTVRGPVTAALVSPDATSTTETCGTAGTIRLPLKPNDEASKRFKIRVTASSTVNGAVKTDKDVLVFRCSPGDRTCPPNPAGGPNEFEFTIQQEATDFDIGWTGASHDQPMVSGTTLRMCLKDCDASGTTPCTQADRTRTVNGKSFGAPLPLVASQVKVCVVNGYDPANKVSGGTVDFATGEMGMTLNLLADVHLGELCPNCSGQTIGAAGKCLTGTNKGAACVTEGIVTVPGQGTFTVSASCPPSAAKAGTLVIPLGLTTGASRLNGPRPCGAISDHYCSGDGPCNRTDCTCQSTDSNGNCVAALGGITQYCCAGNPGLSCHPTANGELGYIERIGTPEVPLPAAPDPTFPKCGTNAVLAATFCGASTNSSSMNGVAGLPGPGAGLFPIHWQLKATGDPDCP